VIVDVGTRLAIEDLFARYAHTIDDDRLEEWPALFTEDCLYQVISAENWALKRPIGLIHCDNRAMLQDRVTSLRQANIYEAQGYRHMLSATLVTHFHRDEARVVSNYQVTRIMQDGSTLLFSCGRYLDRIKFTKAGPLFAERVVVYDNRRVDTLLAIPL
jgi:anthranilate 1,2-dioxygenase small subunit